MLKARFLADVEDFAGAMKEIRTAVGIEPLDQDALAFGYALGVATGDTLDHSFGRTYAQHFKDARAEVAAAELLARVRQYAQAADMAREAIAIDSTNWQAYGVLGMNLLRLGAIAGRARTSRSRSPAIPTTCGSRTRSTCSTRSRNTTRSRTAVPVHDREGGITDHRAVSRDIADRRMRRSLRDTVHTEEPIRVEVYRSHADFSVRTVGLAGIGALGVSFGNTVAFDSPAAKDAGPFNWASTAWHEIAHTFTLGASDMRMPRWFSEGLSVYEERKTQTGWGQNVSPAFIQAYSQKKLRAGEPAERRLRPPGVPEQVFCRTTRRRWCAT